MIRFNLFLIAERFKCLAFSFEGWSRRNSNRVIKKGRKGRCGDEERKYSVTHSFIR